MSSKIDGTRKKSSSLISISFVQIHLVRKNSTQACWGFCLFFKGKKKKKRKQQKNQLMEPARAATVAYWILALPLCIVLES